MKTNGEARPTTNEKYWDLTYQDKQITSLYITDNYKHHIDHLIMKTITDHYNGGDIIELGAGGSDWLIRAAKQLKPNHCTGLDYSKEGCRLLKKKSEANEVKIEVINADMFEPPLNTIGKFGFTMSFGVVEHFNQLSSALTAISKFSKPGGLIYTLIPNMSGLNGFLTKLWNKEVYDIHIPHNLDTFTAGHNGAGLNIISAEYLGSSSFGVLSSCFQNRQTGINYFLYKQLTRLSKLIWLFESKVTPLPATKFLSPYIVIVSKKPE
jgi:ubiquinone/menaquinone biosynthesis C-methylase UbiE